MLGSMLETWVTEYSSGECHPSLGKGRLCLGKIALVSLFSIKFLELVGLKFAR